VYESYWKIFKPCVVSRIDVKLCGEAVESTSREYRKFEPKDGRLSIPPP
jgi:hypothetical protein